MPNPSLQGWIHGGSREVLAASLAGTFTAINNGQTKKAAITGGLLIGLAERSDQLKSVKHRRQRLFVVDATDGLGQHRRQ
jgi:hypothetical protein